MKASTSNISGKVAATFIAASAALIMIGILAYFRKQLPWLEIHPPVGTFGGIWFYSYIIWAIIWVGLFFILRNRESVGSIKMWLIVFLASLAFCTIMVEASLEWELLFGGEEEEGMEEEAFESIIIAENAPSFIFSILLYT